MQLYRNSVTACGPDGVWNPLDVYRPKGGAHQPGGAGRAGPHWAWISAYLPAEPTGAFLADCCMPVAALLREQNVPTEAKLYGDKRTGHVFHLNIRSEPGRRANREELSWRAGQLPGKPLPRPGAVTA